MARGQRTSHPQAPTTTDMVMPTIRINAAQRIPQEIFDHIIHLTEESAWQVRHERSLATFSLVCRAWLPASRFCFFRRRRIYIDPRKAGTFNALMQSPHATLTRYIRHLQINWLTEEWDPEYEITTIPDSLRRLPPFTSLETLRLWEFADTHFVSMDNISGKFQTITHLELYDCFFDTTDRLSRFISSLPLLDYLSLQKVTWSNITMVPIPQCARLSFRSLVVQEKCPTFPFLVLMLSFHSLPPLHTLRLEFEFLYEENRALNQILQTLGPSLKDLHITNRSGVSIGIVDLSHNTCLRVIQINCPIPLDTVLSADWIYILLASIHSPDIEEATFCNLRHRPANARVPISLPAFQCSSFQKLDRLLSQPRFQGLQRVDFIRFPTEPTNIHESMPSCFSRGV